MKLLLVYDIDGWTWHRRAQDLKAYAPEQYDVTIQSRGQYDKRYGWDLTQLREFDAVFFFSWTSHPLDTLKHCNRAATLATCHGLEFDQAVPHWYPTWAVTPSRCKWRAMERLPRFDAVITVNDQLREVVAQYVGNRAEVHLIPSGVNTRVFVPGSQRTEGPLRVGWCAQTRGTWSVKGHREILQPLMAQLGDNEFDWVINDRDYRNALDRPDMVRWYHGIDVFLCTSICEGTPSPVFEAASCERVVFSTDVGMVADWSLAHELDFVAPAYRNAEEVPATIGWFAERLRWLASHRTAAPEYGSALRQGLMGWCDYGTVAPKYLAAIAGA